MGPLFEQVTDVSGYHLAEQIGSGGMGEVFKAYNSSLNRFAAVKILYEDIYAERFKNEAYIQSSINHPNIARLYEYATNKGRHCIVMEYVEGESMDALLHRKKKLSNEETEDILRQIISALAYLHKKDIFHRDIKPTNFKVQPDGTVKMLDFGIAKHKYSPKFTQIGSIVGTTEYMAPEQFQQRPELKSDIWALAVLCYELVTGYMPFEASNPVELQSKILKGVFTNPKILLPQLSENLSTIIDKGLKVNPATRINAADIATLLGKKDLKTVKRIYLFGLTEKRLLILAVAGLTVLVILFLLINNNDEVKKDEAVYGVQEEKKVLEAVSTGSKIIINVPGISKAELILKNGEHRPLPYTLTGKEGDKFEFTIHADGYNDKDVQVVITPRRISYEFNLEKK
ncbi:MAG: serine/threonine-protein kinase [Chitinophagaceae bacterium]